MESFNKTNSFFQDTRSRELHGFRKRWFIGEMASDFTEVASVPVQHNGEETPPLAVSFCKSNNHSHIFAVSDEDGYVSLFDTRRKLPFSAFLPEIAEKARVSDWVAHQNAIFDVCWIKEDTNILTASGDQTIKVWDVQQKKCTGVLLGHKGSVKSLSPHPANFDLLISGSRDGSLAMWDLRCKVTAKRSCSEAGTSSTAMVQKAHLSPQAKRVRQCKAASISITSVLCLKDEVSIATAGAVDSIIKFWDTRNLNAQVSQACPHVKSPIEKERRLHGISSLSQDLNGVFLAASCMDNRIYLYNVLRLEKGPLQSFSGCRIESFYVKSAISPNAAHILSGSSDGNAYIWQVNKPNVDPITLKTHDGEVTAVDWCPSEVGKLATSSDDYTVRVWNIQKSFCLHSSGSPSAIRRRVMAIPRDECSELLMNEELMGSIKDPANLLYSDEVLNQKSTISITMPTISTPKAHKKKFSPDSDAKETFEKTPEPVTKSPSSVLNPPSLKRTIRDYFLTA